MRGINTKASDPVDTRLKGPALLISEYHLLSARKYQGTDSDDDCNGDYDESRSKEGDCQDPAKYMQHQTEKHSEQSSEDSQDETCHFENNKGQSFFLWDWPCHTIGC